MAGNQGPARPPNASRDDTLPRHQRRTMEGPGPAAPGPPREIGGFLATVLTGGQLIAAAVFCGLMARMQALKNRGLRSEKEGGGSNGGTASPVAGDPVTGIKVIE